MIKDPIALKKNDMDTQFIVLSKKVLNCSQFQHEFHRVKRQETKHRLLFHIIFELISQGPYIMGLQL